MKILYIASAFVAVWLAGWIAERVNYLAMKRTQDRYNAMQKAYIAHLEEHYRKVE